MSSSKPWVVLEGLRLDHSYLTGIFLAVNALKNSYMLVDAPNCCYQKIEYIDKNHDLFSELFFNYWGHPRIANTESTPLNIASDNTKKIENMLVNIGAYKGSEVVFLASMPLTSITGIQYDLIVRKAQKKCRTTIIELPAKNARYDWLTGYADVLIALAKKVKLKKGLRSKNKVAIIGYLFDRNEGDHLGNVQEMKKLLRSLSLQLVSTWLAGTAYNDLGKVQHAEFIISLPYGREAAEILAKRTGAKLIYTELPFGLNNTKKWIEKILKGTGCKKQKNNNEQEMLHLKEVIAGFKKKQKKSNKYSVIIDAGFSEVFLEGLSEIGCKVAAVIEIGDGAKNAGKNNIRVLKNPNYEIIESTRFQASDIGIGNSLGKPFFEGKPYIQFGFPTPGYHCFTMKPYLGYKGFINFINRLENIIDSGVFVNN
jgi:nitrogenase molybdenum-cofactor synthesis protein NifE